jgi:hypothetical protein
MEKKRREADGVWARLGELISLVTAGLCTPANSRSDCNCLCVKLAQASVQAAKNPNPSLLDIFPKSFTMGTKATHLLKVCIKVVFSLIIPRRETSFAIVSVRSKLAYSWTTGVSLPRQALDMRIAETGGFWISRLLTGCPFQYLWT